MIEFLLNELYGHGIVLVSVLILKAVIVRFDEGVFLQYGVYELIAWMFIEFYFVINADIFWINVLILTAASLLPYLIFIGIAVLCGKYGTAGRGDGFAWGYMLPPFIYIYVFLFFLILKGIAVIWHFLVSLL